VAGRKSWKTLGFFREFPRNHNREFLAGIREFEFPDPRLISEWSWPSWAESADEFRYRCSRLFIHRACAIRLDIACSQFPPPVAVKPSTIVTQGKFVATADMISQFGAADLPPNAREMRSSVA
jgi:hypothetical protein